MPKSELDLLREDHQRMTNDLFSVAEALGVDEEWGGGLSPERMVMAIQDLKERCGHSMVKVSKILKWAGHDANTLISADMPLNILAAMTKDHGMWDMTNEELVILRKLLNSYYGGRTLGALDAALQKGFADPDLDTLVWEVSKELKGQNLMKVGARLGISFR